MSIWGHENIINYTVADVIPSECQEIYT